MNLKDKLLQDLHKAMKARDVRRIATIRLARAAIVNTEVEKEHSLSDEEIHEVLNKEAKKRREAIEEYGKAHRQDRVQQEEEELSILLEYLPKQLSRAEIEAMVRQATKALAATDPRQVGEVMGHLMPKIKGKADGRLVNQVVQELLGVQKR